MPALIIFFIAFFSSFFGTFESNSLERIDDIYYQVKPVPIADRTNLEISVRFRAEPGKPQTIKLPTDYYNGAPDIYRYVTTIKGESGTVLKPGADETERSVKPNSAGLVSLSYVISYDPKVMDEFPFSPGIDPDYFHVAGCQWMLHIGDDNQKRHYKIEITGAPQNWHLYSSLSENPGKAETFSSYEDLITTALGGGRQAHFFSVRQKPVSVFVHGKFNIPANEIFASVEKIIRQQRNWFIDYSQSFFHIVITRRSGFIAGTAIKNLFICFVKPEISRDELNVDIAHEMLHEWVPGKIRIDQDKKFSRARLDWFDEGFDDYLAGKLLLDGRLLSKKTFVELINKDIIAIADNPYRSADYSSISQKSDSAAKKLSYYRGSLIALNWEAQIRTAGKNRGLLDLIRDLYRRAAKNSGHIMEQEFFALAAGYGIEAEKDLDRYIMRGEPISPDANALGNNYVLREAVIPSFDPGFSITESFRTGKITGATENGPAYKAGLRNGMEFIRAENFARFSNSWLADKPLTVIVKINGSERAFNYSPSGTPHKLMLFEPVIRK